MVGLIEQQDEERLTGSTLGISKRTSNIIIPNPYPQGFHGKLYHQSTFTLSSVGYTLPEL